MRIERLHIKNYRVFADATLEDLPGFCVLVGRNGVGKSTLFDVFGFLRDCLQDNVRVATRKRGGFDEVVTRGHHDEAIEIEIQFRMPIAEVNRLVTYRLEIAKDAETGQPVVAHETLRYKRGRYGAPYRFLDFQLGTGEAVSNEEDFQKEDEDLERETHVLGSKDILAIKGLGQFERFKAAAAFRTLIENWHVSDFRIDVASRSVDAGYAEHLSPTGDNLALVAQYMFEHHADVFGEVVQAMRSRVPGIGNVEAIETEDGRVVLQFEDGRFKDPFVARYVSDGTIKMFAYLVLLYDPQTHPLLCVEEPENQLFPQLLAELAEEFRAYSIRGGQVFVSTHSPDLLEAANPDEVYVLEKVDGVTRVSRAMDNPQVAAYMDDGDSMGRLWRDGILCG